MSFSTTSNTGAVTWVPRAGNEIATETFERVDRYARISIVSNLATYGMIVLGCDEGLACSVAEQVVGTHDHGKVSYAELLEHYREEIGAVPL